MHAWYETLLLVNAMQLERMTMTDELIRQIEEKITPLQLNNIIRTLIRFEARMFQKRSC